MSSPACTVDMIDYTSRLDLYYFMKHRFMNACMVACNDDGLVGNNKSNSDQSLAVNHAYMGTWHSLIMT
jgi:hypothetical protein